MALDNSIIQFINVGMIGLNFIVLSINIQSNALSMIGGQCYSIKHNGVM